MNTASYSQALHILFDLLMLIKAWYEAMFHNLLNISTLLTCFYRMLFSTLRNEQNCGDCNECRLINA